MAKKADENLIIQEYQKVGSITQVGKNLSLSRKTVGEWLHRNGIETPHSGPKAKVEESLIAELYKNGKSTRQIAKEVGLGKTRIQYVVRKLGLSRSKSESTKLPYQFGYRDISGDNHPRWKGGRFLSGQSGYVMIHCPNHPRVKNPSHPYVQEHILVLEKKLGRPLAPDEVGHHINGVKDDNRPENLVAMKKGKHHSKLLLLALQQRIRELESRIAG